VFTGIVEEVGRVRSIDREGDGVCMWVDAVAAREGVNLGDSISVDGACLTISSLDAAGFAFGLAPETLRRTTLGSISPEGRVNLERAVRVGDRLGGHYVQGHVDGMATIVAGHDEGDSLVLTFEAPTSLAPYIVEKGFVAIDGVSLTVTERVGTRFSVALVAYTRRHIALGDKLVSSSVNVEVDIIAKYVESILGSRSGARPPALPGEA
jgi:riboflavin synthase